jgi:hypothetical protein
MLTGFSQGEDGSMIDFLDLPLTDEQRDWLEDQAEAERRADAIRLGLSPDAGQSEINRERQRRRIRKLGLDPETATRYDIELAALRSELDRDARSAWHEGDDD